MGIRIGIGKIVIGQGLVIPNWTPPIITSISVLNTSDTTQTITLTIVGTDYDDVSYEYSSDGVNYTVKGTAVEGTYNATGMPAGNTCYWRARLRKGVKYSAYSSTQTSIISNLLTGLVDYWKFDEASGNATGVKGNVLTNNNMVSYAAGKLNNGIDLGSSNTNKNLQKDSDFGMTYASSKSVAAWVNINTAPANGVTEALVTLMYATNPGNYFGIFYRQNVTLQLYDGTNAKLQTLTPGTWYHVAVTWDQTGNVAKMYLNGDLINTGTCFTSDYHAQANRFSIGNFGGVLYAQSKVDEVALYSRILSSADVKNLYNLGIGGYSHPFGNNEITLMSTAYCWFARPRALYNASVNKTWIGTGYGLANAFTQQVLTIDNTTGTLTQTTVGTAIQSDDHIEATLLVRASDNKLFTCYTEHAKVGSPIRYRISTNALDATAWGAESTKDPDNPNTYTYPSCFQVANGDIYIFYRNTTTLVARWCYIKSTDGGVNFGAQVQVGANAGTGPTYCNIIQNLTNKDIIHFIGSPHPNEGLATSRVIHFYFDAGAGTWHKSDGTDITANLPLQYTIPTAIFTKTSPEQVWIEDIFLDSNGYPRVLMTHYPDEVSNFKLKNLYYSEWTGSAWTTPYLIHQSLDRDISNGTPKGEISYPPLACFDRGNANRIFAAKEVSGKCEIFVITRVAANSFTSVQKTFNSYYDQWRPFSVDSVLRNAFWLNKINYTSYESFSQQLVCATF